MQQIHILLIDNYDSFTYNLVQYLERIPQTEVTVIRNDEITLEAVAAYDAIVLSPGPGLPEEAGLMPAILKMYAHLKPILGVCLGHQAIGEAFGGSLQNLEKVYHGLETPIDIISDRDPILKGLPSPFMAGRYHSWVVNKADLPDCLEITAVDHNGQIMAMRHKTYSVFGVQYHPESIMTPLGMQMLVNFVGYVRSNIAFREDLHQTIA